MLERMTALTRRDRVPDWSRIWTLILSFITLGAIFCAQEESGVSSTRTTERLIRGEIHSKHFFYGCPAGESPDNDLIIRDIYALSSNDETKLADWVAYGLDKKTITGTVTTRRNFKADPWLDDHETLEPDDYIGAYAALEMDRGHQAPLASFKGTDLWQETNYLSNITPQKSDLNRGLWRELEGRVRDLVQTEGVAYVMTGPLYERETDSLPGADEPHRIPSGYWKIVAVDSESIRCASFLFDQEGPWESTLVGHLCSIDDIESRSGLDFMSQLTDSTEERIENDRHLSWAEANFD